jgi:hypothetical protein
MLFPAQQATPPRGGDRDRSPAVPVRHDLPCRSLNLPEGSSRPPPRYLGSAAAKSAVCARPGRDARADRPVPVAQQDRARRYERRGPRFDSSPGHRGGTQVGHRKPGTPTRRGPTCRRGACTPIAGAIPRPGHAGQVRARAPGRRDPTHRRPRRAGARQGGRAPRSHAPAATPGSCAPGRQPPRSHAPPATPGSCAPGRPPPRSHAPAAAPAHPEPRSPTSTPAPPGRALVHPSDPGERTMES